MTSAIFAHALKEASRFRRVAPWLFIGILCFFLARFWPNIVPSADPTQSYVSVVALAAVRVLALGSAILTTAVIGQEIEGRTIVYLLTRPVPRWLLLFVRFAASVLVVFVLSAAALAFTSLGSGGGGAPYLARDIAVIGLGAVSYGALFLFISLAVNRALIWCVLFAFGWETAVPTMPGDIYRASILSHLQAAMQHPKVAGGGVLNLLGGAPAISPRSGVTTLVVISAVLLALSAWWFTKFEFVPREDAE